MNPCETFLVSMTFWPALARDVLPVVLAMLRCETSRLWPPRMLDCSCSARSVSSARFLRDLVEDVRLLSSEAKKDTNKSAVPVPTSLLELGLTGIFAMSVARLPLCIRITSNQVIALFSRMISSRFKSTLWPNAMNTLRFNMSSSSYSSSPSCRISPRPIVRRRRSFGSCPHWFSRLCNNATVSGSCATWIAWRMWSYNSLLPVSAARCNAVSPLLDAKVGSAFANNSARLTWPVGSNVRAALTAMCSGVSL
mmetsp:Transcript_73435/g.203943  ORF Transcript_73435/g.203943 Transcript_73435/m.203943 type:complete len:252 (+) Transcript_73435:177-932(+)